MNAAEMKKLVKKLMKEKFTALDLAGITKKVTSERCLLYRDDEEIGYISLAYVSSGFSEHGSLFGVYVQCGISGGPIASALKQIGLSYPPCSQLFDTHYFGTTSLRETDKVPLSKRFARKNGTISFFENDNIEEKCSQIVQKMQDIYIQEMLNFALGRMQVIDDILENGSDYAYPTASIIVACYLNGRKQEIDEIVRKARSKKLYGGGSPRIDEALQTVEKFFTMEANEGN